MPKDQIPESPEPREPNSAEPRGDSVQKSEGRKIGPSFQEPEEHMTDLSAEIVNQVDRSPGERVTCRRIVGSYYRCNWWARERSGSGIHDLAGMTVTTHRVSRSQLLHATWSGNRLILAPTTGRNAQPSALLSGLSAAERTQLRKEHDHWRSHFARRTYIAAGSSYDQYAPAYEYGWFSQIRNRDQSFEDAESELGRHWDRVRGDSTLDWEQAKDAARDAWNRAASTSPKP